MHEAEGLRFTKIITFPEFHSFFSKELGDIFWLTDSNFYKKNNRHFLDTLKLFKDKKSIDNYSLLIEYLSTFNTKSLPNNPDFSGQYFPKDIDVWDGNGALLDIGSYDGENIFDAYKIYGILDFVIAFEPDLRNFEKLANRNLKDIVKQYLLYPCGVYSKTTVLNFLSGSEESSSLSDIGDHSVPVVKIDDIINIKPGYLKMDIEGAEFEALVGARDTITKFKPSSAVSLYHRPNHFYQIPELIYSWDLNYKFFIRFHANNFFETVLYCLQ